MENTLTAGAFTEERVEVISMLSAQATISMENAKLYDEQVRLIRAQRRFVPSQFLESLGHHDIAAVGLGEYVSRDMSVMFSDLRGFTPMVERMGPGAVIELLNGYFSSLAPSIAEAGGFIDSFNGDEIMALFGVTADAAVSAGIQMWRALETFNLESTQAGGPALKMGIGMDTGPLVLGTVGGRNRLKCGVVGDTVNLSSRIEQLTKLYDVPFLIGEGTHDALQNPHDFTLRRIDRVAVKGKLQSVTLYEVLDAESGARRHAKEATRELLDTVWTHYLARDFATASEASRDAIAMNPDDPVFSLMNLRCERYRLTPPPPEWDGVENLIHK
jgi:class 3 adenylate cyclase